MDTGMVWPLAVRSTVSRASGAALAEIEGAAVRLVDEADERLAHQVRFAVAEQSLRGLVAALDDAVGRGHDHRVAQAVEHRVEIVLGDGGFAQLLPHALERVLQLAELVAAHDVRAGGCSRLRRSDRRIGSARRWASPAAAPMNQAPIRTQEQPAAA